MMHIARIQSLVKAMSSYPDLPWIDAWSTGQIQSKLWILDELSNINRKFSCVYVMGGWLGVLPWLLLGDDRFSIGIIRSFDIDPACEPAADKLNIGDKMNSWRFKAVTADATQMKYSSDGYHDFVGVKSDGTYSKSRPEHPDCIINTSCDHFSNLDGWIASLPCDSLIVLQNTNIAHDDTHVNCVDTIDGFAKQAKLATLLYLGEIEISGYKRFMIIGKK